MVFVNTVVDLPLLLEQTFLYHLNNHDLSKKTVMSR